MADIIEIPVQNFELLQQKVAKLNKTCERLTGKKIRIMPIGKREIKNPTTGRIAEILEIYVTAPDMKIPGWEFVGRVDHRTFRETRRNVVFMNPETKEPNTYWETPSHCDHCEENRRRNFTYILRAADGELKQVGSSCLRDFLGYEPVKILKLFEYLQRVTVVAKGYSRGPLPEDYLFINTQVFVAAAILDIQENGWVSAGVSRETGRLATWERANDTQYDVADLPLEAAAQAITDAQMGPDLSSFDKNLRTIALATNVGHNMLPTAAVIAQKWVAKQPKPVRDDLSKSVHFAQVGDKFLGTVRVIGTKIVTSQFGESLLVRMMQQDNLIITFTSGKFNPKVGDVVSISGRVKKNDTFNGVAQTQLSNVRAK